MLDRLPHMLTLAATSAHPDRSSPLSAKNACTIAMADTSNSCGVLPGPKQPSSRPAVSKIFKIRTRFMDNLALHLI